MRSFPGLSSLGPGRIWLHNTRGFVRASDWRRVLLLLEIAGQARDEVGIPDQVGDDREAGPR